LLAVEVVATTEQVEVELVDIDVRYQENLLVEIHQLKLLLQFLQRPIIQLRLAREDLVRLLGHLEPMELILYLQPLLLLVVEVVQEILILMEQLVVQEEALQP
jgi:hypothetical protein